MTKITSEHLARVAFVYIRQSTPDQLKHNHESRRRQYAQADRARALGWSEVMVVDDDLGRSGSGIERPGFERLLLTICEARGRHRAGGRGVAPGPQRPGLAHSVGVLRSGRLSVGGRSRGLRPTAAERPIIARHEGNDERDGAVAAAATLARGLAPESATWRVVLHRHGRLPQSPARSY